MIALINASNIAHSFDNLLFSNVNLSLSPKDSIAILGPSGSGKSTLINILSTLLPPKEGKLSILESSDIYSKKESKILNIRKNEIGIIFQQHYLFRGFNALDNLKVTSFLTNKEIDFNLLEILGISHLLKKQIGELSGGEQQRFSIARVLLKKPKIIFADEPTGNLDSFNTLNVMEAIFKYIDSYNGALITATHDINVANMCKKKYILKNKELIQIWN